MGLNVQQSPNDRLKILRQELKKTQSEMASDLYLRQSYYSDIENKRRTVSAKLIQKLKELLRVSPEWMYNGEGSMFTLEGDKLYTNLVPQSVPSKGLSEISVNLIDGLIRNSLQLLNFYCETFLYHLSEGENVTSVDKKHLKKYIHDLGDYVEAFKAKSPLNPSVFENYDIDEKILLLHQLNLRIGECLDLIWISFGHGKFTWLKQE